MSALLVSLFWMGSGGGLARDPQWIARAMALSFCGAIYFARVVVMLFVFLRRPFGWVEAGTLAVLCIFLHLGSAWSAIHLPATAMWQIAIGMALYGCGSVLNSASEWLRERFVARGDGTLFVGGPYAHVRHPNYLGDVILFAGWATIVGSAWAQLVPLTMLALFIAIHIPKLERHLGATRGAAFDVWARQSKRILPWIY